MFVLSVIIRKPAVQPDQRVAPGELRLPHRVPLLGSRSARDRHRLQLELLGAPGRHGQRAGWWRRRWTVGRRVRLRGRRRRPVARVRAEKQCYGPALLYAGRCTSEAGDCAVEHRQLSQLSRLLHAVR